MARSIAILSLLFCGSALAQDGPSTWFNPVGTTITDGTTSNAAPINNNFTGIINDGNTGETNLLAQAAAIPAQGLPSGAVVMIGTGTTCPANYNVADGTHGTADLRGVYVRGTGGFASGLGSLQADAFQTHTHSGTGQNSTILLNGNTIWTGTAFNPLTGIITVTPGTTTSGQAGMGTETRPASVVLLHCAKQ